jgi:hypothetical protein
MYPPRQWDSFAAAAIAAAVTHVSFETWVTPAASEALAIAALGAFPMGLALYFWDFGVKRGDMQALGGASYFEPLLGAVFVAIAGQGDLELSLIWAGLLIILGAGLASRNVWRAKDRGVRSVHQGYRVTLERASVGTRPSAVATVGASIALLQELLLLIEELLRERTDHTGKLDHVQTAADAIRQVCRRTSSYVAGDVGMAIDPALWRYFAEIIGQLDRLQNASIRKIAICDSSLRQATILLENAAYLMRETTRDKTLGRR